MAKKSGKSPKSAKPKKQAAEKTAPPAAKAVTQPRVLKRPARLPSAWRLTRSAWEVIWRHKELFFGITLVYGLLNLILVQGLAGSTDVTSLAVIWALRQVLAGAAVRIRDAYYLGMSPLIPFILVLLFIGLELLPLLVGSSLYALVISNGIAVNLLEKILFMAIFAGLAAVSLYLVSASVFAVYIVTLPDMTPRKALRSASQLVKGRRWAIIRKTLFLPIILLVAAAVIMVPIIILLTAAAQWVFFLLTMFALVAIHSYMYTMYRELLNE